MKNKTVTFLLGLLLLSILSIDLNGQTIQTRLENPTFDGSDFGHTLAIENDYIAVGAKRQLSYGSVYIYKKDATNGWPLLSTIESTDPTNVGQFGNDISISGDLMLIGAPSEKNHGELRRGAVYLYKLINDNWELQQVITPADGAEYDYFGNSVQIDGNRILIIASGDDHEEGFGSLYYYEWNGTTANLVSKFFPEQYSDYKNLILEDDYAIFRADNEADLAVVLIYYFDGNEWVLQNEINSFNGTTINLHKISFSGDFLAIRATNHNVYIFKKEGTNWVEYQQIYAPMSSFYESVSIHNDLLALGEVNYPSDDGAVHLYRHILGVWRPINEFSTDPATYGFSSFIHLKDDKLIGSSIRSGQREQVTVFENLVSCEAPTISIDLTQLTLNKVLLSIDNLKSADVVAQYRAIGTNNWIDLAVDSSVICINDIMPGVEYECQVGVECDGNMYWSPITLFEIECEAPTISIDLIPFTLDKVLLSINALPSPNLLAQYRPAGTTDWIDLTVDSMVICINNLVQGVEYESQVGVECGGNMYWSPITSFEIPNCSIPDPIGIDIISGNVVRFGWDVQLGEFVEKFRIQYRKEGTSEWIERNAFANYLFLNELDISTSYQYRFKTVCTFGNSIWSATQSFTTADFLCDRPNINTITASSSSITIDWDPIPNAEKYKILYKRDGESMQSLTTQLVNYTLTDLYSNSEYKVLIKAKCPGGWTNRQVPFYVMTSNFTGDNPVSKSINPSTEFTVFPNPTSDYLQVNLNTEDDGIVKIFNNSGQLLKEQNIAHKTLIDISSFSNGIYFIRFESNGFIDQKRFIKIN